MLRKSNIDKDSNSIFNASSKLATIAVRNMKNPSDDPNMQLGLNQLPKTNILSTSNNNINKSTSKSSNNLNSEPKTKNTYVDEFLGKILDASSYLQQMYLWPHSVFFPEGDYGRFGYNPLTDKYERDRHLFGGMLEENEDNDENNDERIRVLVEQARRYGEANRNKERDKKEKEERIRTLVEQARRYGDANRNKERAEKERAENEREEKEREEYLKN